MLCLRVLEILSIIPRAFGAENILQVTKGLVAIKMDSEKLVRLVTSH
jgi:hypothetical protein